MRILRYRTGVSILLLGLAASGPGKADHLPASFLPSAPAIHCSGNDQIDIVDRRILATRDAIQAHGNCRVRLTGVHIVVDNIAVQASGNAQVVIEHSFVQGARQAIKVTGNAVVRYRDSTVRGAIFAAAGGKAIDEQGNAVERLPDPVSAPLAPTPTLRCGDREHVVLLHRGIDVPGDSIESGIEVAAGCVLDLSDSYIRADGWGIRIDRGGRATVRNSVIETGEAGIVITGGGVLHIAGSSISNGLRALDEATVIDGGGNAWEP